MCGAFRPSRMVVVDSTLTDTAALSPSLPPSPSLHHITTLSTWCSSVVPWVSRTSLLSLRVERRLMYFFSALPAPPNPVSPLSPRLLRPDLFRFVIQPCRIPAEEDAWCRADAAPTCGGLRERDGPQADGPEIRRSDYRGAGRCAEGVSPFFYSIALKSGLLHLCHRGQWGTTAHASQALTRLTPRESYDRIYRHRVAFQQSILHRPLPKEQWIKKEDVRGISIVATTELLTASGRPIPDSYH